MRKLWITDKLHCNLPSVVAGNWRTSFCAGCKTWVTVHFVTGLCWEKGVSWPGLGWGRRVWTSWSPSAGWGPSVCAALGTQRWEGPPRALTGLMCSRTGCRPQGSWHSCFLATRSPLIETRAGRLCVKGCVVLGDQSLRPPQCGRGSCYSPGSGGEAQKQTSEWVKHHACSQSLWLMFTWSNELKQRSDELTLAPLLHFRQCSPWHSTRPSPFLPHLKLFLQALPQRSSFFTRSWSQGSLTLHSPLHLSQSDVLHSRHLSELHGHRMH